MKEQDPKLTIQETEQLCRLYMNCRLSVLEETELQYVLGKLPYSSPCIDEARMLMGLTIHPEALTAKKKVFNLFRNKAAISIAATITALLAIGIALLHNQSVNEFSHDDVYVAAYIHGERLNGNEVINVTNLAMAKADSLMTCASLTERDYVMRANNMISTTIKN